MKCKISQCSLVICSSRQISRNFRWNCKTIFCAHKSRTLFRGGIIHENDVLAEDGDESCRAVLSLANLQLHNLAGGAIIRVGIRVNPAQRGAEK